MAFPVGCPVLYNMRHEGSFSGPEGPEKEPSWHVPFHGIYRSLLSRPWKGLERRLHGIPVWCSVLYNMHHEGSSSPGPGRAWRGGFMVFLFGALCYTICTMKAPPQALEGPEEHPLWHLS